MRIDGYVIVLAKEGVLVGDWCRVTVKGSGHCLVSCIDAAHFMLTAADKFT